LYIALDNELKGTLFGLPTTTTIIRQMGFFSGGQNFTDMGGSAEYQSLLHFVPKYV